MIYIKNYISAFIRGISCRKSNIVQLSKQNQNESYRNIVICVHGIMQNGVIFEKIAQNLDADVYVFNYPSLFLSLELVSLDLVLDVIKILSTLPKHEKYRLSFIGHSMGGIVIDMTLNFLNREKIPYHDYITIATPFNGAKSARILRKIIPKIFIWEALQEITKPYHTKNDFFPEIILGHLTGINRSLTSKDLGDGIVTDKECIPENFDKDVKIINAGHTPILWKKETIEYIKQILSTPRDNIFTISKINALRGQ